MPTKQKSKEKVYFSITDVLESNGSHYVWPPWPDENGVSTITYPSAPRLPNGNWPWKECLHTTTNYWNGVYCYDGSFVNRSAGGATNTVRFAESLTSTPDTLGADPGWNSSVCQGIMDQLDLNKGESCLMYANVIQALPFLGAATKLTSILNNAARRFGKGIRKKPFSTAVKTLISADFVDRFVISPTIDDARKFATATNYVANKLATVEDRNSHPFSLDAELTTVFKERESSQSSSCLSYGCGWLYNYTKRYRTRAVDKAFVLLEATYTTDALTPFRLWANRTGFSKPLDSAWDLVPFSFVLDYFFRAGDFISALSEEMSSDQGLRGTITRVLGMWGSHLYESTCTATLNSFSRRDGAGAYPYNVWNNMKTGVSAMSSSIYRRFPVPNPYAYLIPLEEKLSDYLTVNLDLSSTRKRTLAELVIQAKL